MTKRNSIQVLVIAAFVALFSTTAHAADGTVPTSQVTTSTLGSAAVEQCVAQRFARMQFPQPKGGGVVFVT